MHYARQKKHGDPNIGAQILRSKICSVCPNLHAANGYCRNHARRFKLYGDPFGKPESKPMSKDGYIWIYVPEHPNADKKGMIAQHRYVMSEHLDRPLHATENVHHKNGQRNDNRVENLELWSKVQPAGQRVSDKIRWALELLEQYGTDPTLYE